MPTKRKKKSGPEYGPAIKYRATTEDIARLQWLTKHYEMNGSATMRRLILEAWARENSPNAFTARLPKVKRARKTKAKSKARPRKSKRTRKPKAKRTPELRAAA